MVISTSPSVCGCVCLWEGGVVIIQEDPSAAAALRGPLPLSLPSMDGWLDGRMVPASMSGSPELRLRGG